VHGQDCEMGCASLHCRIALWESAVHLWPHVTEKQLSPADPSATKGLCLRAAHCHLACEAIKNETHGYPGKRDSGVTSLTFSVQMEFPHVKLAQIKSERGQRVLSQQLGKCVITMAFLFDRETSVAPRAQEQVREPRTTLLDWRLPWR
jgi:hypothetical protein